MKQSYQFKHFSKKIFVVIGLTNAGLITSDNFNIFPKRQIHSLSIVKIPDSDDDRVGFLSHFDTSGRIIQASETSQPPLVVFMAAFPLFHYEC